MVDLMREKSRGNGLGNKRWRRYADAFDRVERCLSQGYHLEAIAILDSLIGDRLASRLAHLVGTDSIAVSAVGTLCGKLVGHKNSAGVEVDPAFREVVAEIKTWSAARNDAMHAIARIFRYEDPAVSFDDAMESHRQTVLAGIALLQRFDQLDTAVRKQRRKIPATVPGAFFPEERPASMRDPRPDAR
ncbi:hypothetical protein [Nocardia sp. NPDC127526]|uniref:hypothetical protein n=1 Tax=Nocardia sp. NPDC127526 TaxID=3345393 RepID=UPI00362F9E10